MKYFTFLIGLIFATSGAVSGSSGASSSKFAKRYPKVVHHFPVLNGYTISGHITLRVFDGWKKPACVEDSTISGFGRATVGGATEAVAPTQRKGTSGPPDPQVEAKVKEYMLKICEDSLAEGEQEIKIAQIHWENKECKDPGCKASDGGKDELSCEDKLKCGIRKNLLPEGSPFPVFEELVIWCHVIAGGTPDFESSAFVQIASECSDN